jgi:tetratricopeptide (TPR) repeat protein
MAQKEYDLAIPAFEQCVEMAANQASKLKIEQVHYNIGLCYLILKAYKKGIESFDQAIALRETFTEAYHNRGLCHLRVGNSELACQDWAKALGLGSTFSKKYIDEHCSG